MKRFFIDGTISDIEAVSDPLRWDPPGSDSKVNMQTAYRPNSSNRAVIPDAFDLQGRPVGPESVLTGRGRVWR
jgi:hypothetical protein